MNYENNGCSMSTNPGIFKTSRLQRHSFKRRKDYHHRGNYKFRGLHKKNDFNYRKSNRTAEDVEEEERKKKLNDTAKKLLMKLKSWNAEKNCNKDDPQPNCKISQVVSESNDKISENKINSIKLLKRTAHSKKEKLLTNRSQKGFSQPIKPKYDVNKKTVKDFQNRIQHKLIEEIMQMPKESLQNVLNDPKINPIMELKMSRLVQENKLLIASKLRALAESKMKSLDSSTNHQLLIDIDKLIDPVIETDLSVLPFELIKQMENVFQVQFDYSPENAYSQVVDDVAINHAVISEKVIELNNLEQNVKLENNEDLSFYECSTDEDDDINVFTTATNSDQTKILNESQSCKKNKKLKPLESFKPPSEFKLSSPLFEDGKKESPSSELLLDSLSGNLLSNQFFGEKLDQNTFTREFISKASQTESSCQDAFIQTSEVVETLYGVPVPKETKSDCLFSLQGEANAIQNLINKLNERRLLIFLQMARMSPSGSYLSDDFTKKNFIEAASNGSLNLIDSLKHFFYNHKQRNFNRSRNSFGKKKNENKQRLSIEKRYNEHNNVKATGDGLEKK